MSRGQKEAGRENRWPVIYKKSARARRIIISIKPGEGIVVTVPRGVKQGDAEKFLKQKAPWIDKKIALMESRMPARGGFSEESEFCTRQRRLRISAYGGGEISVRVLKEEIQAKYPSCMEVNSREFQDAVVSGIERALRLEARDYLPERTAFLAGKHGFRYRKVFLKNAKTRWGSCSSVNNINLNIHLMRMPDELIDYVILHELAHTVEKNHSPRFWALLEKVCPGAKEKRKELKGYSTAVC